MNYPLSLEQTPKQKQTVSQRLMMTPQMQKAIELLQAPIMELSQKVEEEMENNPVLEYLEEEGSEAEASEASEPQEMDFDERHLDILRNLDEEFRDHFAESETYNPRRTRDEERFKAYLESSIVDTPTLFDHLMRQAHEEGFSKDELAIAEIIFGCLDQQGYLSSDVSEIAACFNLAEEEVARVLKKVQEFDPPGVAAHDLRELLLLQLKRKKLEGSLAYQIIDRCYDNLLHNRLPQIQKALQVPMENIKEAIQTDISHLEMHPCSHYEEAQAPVLVPDASIKLDEGKLTINVHDGDLQPLRLNRKYLRMLDDPAVAQETKQFIKTKVLSAKWLLKSLTQRNDTLSKIADVIGVKQRAFFLSPEGKLRPMTMKEVADEIDLHESTVARAVANKAIDTPRGLFPLRFFFSNAFIDHKGESHSSKTVKAMIKTLIDEEDKKKPLSDDQISVALKRRGITCARRTIAKYRIELKLGNTRQRRRY